MAYTLYLFAIASDRHRLYLDSIVTGADQYGLHRAFLALGLLLLYPSWAWSSRALLLSKILIQRPALERTFPQLLPVYY